MQVKKMLLVLSVGTLLMPAVVNADPLREYHPQPQHYYHGGGSSWGWVGPAMIGGVIGYELAQPRTVVVQQPPVVYTQPPVVVQQPQVIYNPPVGYHYESILDAHCNCYRTVLVQN